MPAQNSTERSLLVADATVTSRSAIPAPTPTLPSPTPIATDLGAHVQVDFLQSLPDQLTTLVFELLLLLLRRKALPLACYC